MNINYKNLLFAFLVLAISCSDEDSLDQNHEITFGIRHDRSLSEYENIAAKSDPSLPDFNSVVFFEYSLDGSEERDFIASGVIIDEEWILTAGHNFFDAEEQQVPAPISGIIIKIGNDPNYPIATYRVTELVFHPTWLLKYQDINHANDLCLVKVSKAITEVSPVKIINEENEIINSIVWHCGFGDYSERVGQNSDLFSKKHAIENILDRIQGGFQTSYNGQYYFGGLLAFDFDNPDGNINTLGDDIINEDEGYLGSGSSLPNALDFEGTTVTGDSGGPLFILDSGSWKVAGILLGGASDPIQDHIDGNYGDISIYTRVSTSFDWIQSVVKKNLN